MKRISIVWSSTCVAIVALLLLNTGCSTQASKSEFFGKVEPPEGQVLRYVSGPEPESLDPQIGTGQPEARIYMALYEGLVEFDPKTTQPIPAIAESWDVNSDSTEFVFHLRKNARWSNGDPITTQDFLYTFRRGLTPALAARYAYIAYVIKYAQAFNEGGMFVRDPKTNQFVLEKDVAPEIEKSEAAPGAQTATAAPMAGANNAADTPFHRFMHEPARLIVAGDEKDRAKAVAANPKLKAALDGKELVAVKAGDIGVEAMDDYTLRISLNQPAPYFIPMLANPFFRLAPRKAIEKYGDFQWTQPQNIVTCGAFKLASWEPYDQLVVVRDPMYWDATNVKLDKISFYALEDLTTMQNLYKAGDIDATNNHSVPVGWINSIKPLKDYMDAPEAGISYYLINVKKAPMNDRRVRKAFNMAIDKKGLSEFRKVTKPLTAFTPQGIFPGYPQPKGDPFDPERAKQLLAEAGYADASGKFDPKKFPIEDVELTYNTNESNRQVAEFVQAQWKQNLGLTVPLKNMEFKTFLQTRANLDYKGLSSAVWGADYMDPYTFLAIFSTESGDNGTGWFDTKYVEMLNEANSQSDPQKRFDLMAKAEAYLIDAQPVIPLMTNATNWMKKPYVKGMYPNPQTLHAWKFVYIEHDAAKWDRGVPDMKTAD